MAKLTVKQLESLTAKDIGKRLSDEQSLYGTVKARAGGVSVLFRWRYRFGGKLKDVTCGTWPKDTLATIRTKHVNARRILEGGKDPRDEKRISRLQSQAEQAEAADQARARISESELKKARQTVKDLFIEWERKSLKSRKDKGAETRRSFEKDVFPLIGEVAAVDIRRPMIVGVLDTAVERGAPIIARNLLGDMRQMFGFAIVRGLVENDPTSHLKRDSFGKKTERDRVLSAAEIKLFAGAFINARLTKQTVTSVWIMLSTCCRIGELCRARWADIDLVAGVWRIPPENSKNAKAHTIYLSPFASGHFKELRELDKESVWVLPARHIAGHVCLKSMAKQIGDRQRGNKPPMKHRSPYINTLAMPGGKWTPHDLRRTGATMMGELGVRSEVIEKCLNHVEQRKLVRIYQRQKLETEQAEAWRLLGERLELLCMGDADNVVVGKFGAAN